MLLSVTARFLGHHGIQNGYGEWLQFPSDGQKKTFQSFCLKSFAFGLVSQLIVKWGLELP